MKVFIAHSARDFELVSKMRDALREDGHEVVVPFDLAGGSSILSEISSAIRSADVVVAVVTIANPNVFYEVGMATGASVPILAIAPSGALLPSDLASVPYVQLTGDTLRDVQTIGRRIDALGVRPSRAMPDEASAEETLRAANTDPAVLETIPPVEFERLVARLFEERGYEIKEGSGAGDSGVDLVLTSPKDREVVLVQLKKLKRQSRVSVEAVRQLLSVLSTAGVAATGMLLTTSGFTAAAGALAAGTPVILRTLEEVLAAKSKKELLRADSD